MQSDRLTDGAGDGDRLYNSGTHGRACGLDMQKLSLSLFLSLSLSHSLSPFSLPSFFLFLFPFAAFNTIPNYLSVFEQCNFFFYISGHR
jgi:hypothetical protein